MLRKEGFIQPNMPNGEFVEATKMEKVIQRMNYHDLVSYVKPSDFYHVESDINFLFDGKENLIDEKVYSYGTRMYGGDDCSAMALNCYMNMAFLCVHFYREATNTIWTVEKRDLALYKIDDMINFIRFYKEQIDKEKLISIFEDLNIVYKSYYALKILSEFYGNDEVISSVLSTMVDDESFMKEIYDYQNKTFIYREERFLKAAFNVNSLQ